MYTFIWSILSALYGIVAFQLILYGAARGLFSRLRGMWSTIHITFSTILQLLIFLPLDVLHGLACLLFTSTRASNAHQASRLPQLTKHELSRIQRLCGSSYTITSQHIHLKRQSLRMHVIVAQPIHDAKHAPCVMMLHGFPQGWHTWIHCIAPIVKAGYRVVVPDLRGYGSTDTPSSISSYRMSTLMSDIIELIEIVNADTVHRGVYLIGHDWGGILTWLLSICHPHLIHSSLIISAPHPQYWLRSPTSLCRSWYIFLFQLPWIPELILSGLLRGWLYDVLYADGIYTKHDTDYVWSSLSQPHSLRSIIHWYRAWLWYGIRDLHLTSTSTPICVIWGDDDHVMDVSLITSLDRKLIPSMQKLILIPGCGHHVPTLKPDLVVHHALECFASA